MPSKGIKCYAYISVPGVSIEFSVPKTTIKKESLHHFSNDHLEIDTKDLGSFKFSGRFSFTVNRKGKDLATQWVDINALTGNLENGTMNTMEQTPSIFVEDMVIVYGFYDAGPGHAGLPKQHQCYVTVTKNNENWMRDIAPKDSEQAHRPFGKWVLPSAHDIGMNNLQTAQAILAQAGTEIIKDILGRELPRGFGVLNKIADSAIKHIAPDIIRALAVTQKDSLDTVLRIGARYFEFRAAKCHRVMQGVSPLEDTFYFQHGAIPGMGYGQFVNDVVGFLKEHGEEVVVVQLRWDGVPAECPRGTPDERNKIVKDALEGSGIKVGGEQDLKKSIEELRKEGKRLIVMREVNQCSNYDDDASATLDGETIVEKLKGMEPPRGHPVTVLQCQATATNIRDVIVASVLNSDTSTSPLLATKAVCDGKILPLLREETGRKFLREEGLVVVMNDFFDGATADVAIGLCRERLG